ncbi:MAG TPA: SRPBCC family protein [Dehalococcoidia bacterium]|nr:SRPBCC family protein [Dehalococcoidia bacterium]
MPRIRKAIDIEATPEHVFAEVSEPARQVQWALPFRSIEVPDNGPPVQGSVQRWAFKVGPRTWELAAIVTDYRHNQTIARETREGGLHLRDRFTVLPQSGEVTRVEWVIEYEPPMGLLGRLLDALVMVRVFENDMETSLERLKARLEG